MYLLGLGLLVLSTWYLLKLYNDFNNDARAKAEIDQLSNAVKKDLEDKNPFVKGRMKAAVDAYKNSMNKARND